MSFLRRSGTNDGTPPWIKDSTEGLSFMKKSRKINFT